MSENRNIVILGASAGGLSAAHYIARHTLPQLQRSKDAKYTLHLVDPSTHFWWHIAAPRAIVSVKEMKNSDTFVPIMDGFKQYTGLKDSIIFHQGEATALDTNAHTVTIKTHEGGSENLEYYALVIGTGIRSPTPLTTLQGDHTKSQKALEEVNAKLTSAKDIVVGGSGPVAVETAGELGSHFNGKAKITLLAGSDKLLPILSKQRAGKAQKLLESVGVTVKYKTRVESFEESSDGKTVVKLNNGESITTDVYIPATGVKPNTEFLPAELKQANGYVKTNKQTLRVDDAGPRVYAVGDVAGVDKGGMLNMYNTIPVWGANFNHDLFGEAKTGNVAEKKYHFKDAESQLVPVGMKTGVGAFNGWSMPGFMVSKVKGKDYMVRMMPDITQGKKWAKA